MNIKNGYDVHTFVRWLGAYGHSSSLEESFNYELNRKATDEVACEGICGYTRMEHCRIGLLINPYNIIASFNGDCYSQRIDGHLKKGINPRKSGHRYAESFAKIGRHGKNAYIGIVVKNFGTKPASLDNLSPEVRNIVRAVAQKYELPIYTLVDSNVKKLH